MSVGAALLAVFVAAPCASQEDVLPITSARVSQLLQGLAAERPMWARVTAMEDSVERVMEQQARVEMQADEASMRKRDKYQEWSSCSEGLASPMPQELTQHAVRVNQKMGSMSPDMQVAFVRQSEEMEKAAEDAAKRGDAKSAEMIRGAWRKMIAEMTGIPEPELAAADKKMQAWSDANDAKVAKKCGAEPEAPPDMEDEMAERMRRSQNENTRDPIDKLAEQTGVAGAKASGLAARPYAILRERAAAFLASDGSSFGSYKFTDAELAVLRQRRAELARFATELGKTPSWHFDG
jgi:hypothetical protein